MSNYGVLAQRTALNFVVLIIFGIATVLFLHHKINEVLLDLVELEERLNNPTINPQDL